MTAAEVSLVLASVPGCESADCKQKSCLRCEVRRRLMGKPADVGYSITVGSLLSARTKAGMVELVVNDERLQMPISKAREIYGMLGGAIEAAVSDQIVYEIFRDKGLTEAAIFAIVSEMREKRQGSKGVVYAS